MATDDVPGGLTGSAAAPGSHWLVRPTARTGYAPQSSASRWSSYAWAVRATEPFSTIALVCVLIPGVVLRRHRHGLAATAHPPPDKLDITGMFYWVIAVAALFEWEASAWKDNSLPWHPSLTDLINPLLGPHVVKSAAILLWMLVGWALVRR